MAPESTRISLSDRTRICFWFNAQKHQILHGITTAYTLARNPDFDVTVAAPSHDHIRYAREFLPASVSCPVSFEVTQGPFLNLLRFIIGGSVPPKLATLLAFRAWFNSFDAIAMPERTSLVLRRFGVTRPLFIHLDHGAGDRAIGFDPRIRQFDFALMAGEKHRKRLLREGLIRENASAVIGYPKFDAADVVRDPTWSPFPGDTRPIVLYNPHFSSLGSWEKFGPAVFSAFAEQDRYNLIVAPHVRLLDNRKARARTQALLTRYANHPRIYVDTGSDRAIDMTYTMLADIYAGDVSSQVYEFLRTPRPCLFFECGGPRLAK